MQCVFAANCTRRRRAQRSIVPCGINFRIWNLSRPPSLLPRSFPPSCRPRIFCELRDLTGGFLRTTQCATFFAAVFLFGERERRGKIIQHAELFSFPAVCSSCSPSESDMYLDRNLKFKTRVQGGKINSRSYVLHY